MNSIRRDIEVSFEHLQGLRVPGHDYLSRACADYSRGDVEDADWQRVKFIQLCERRIQRYRSGKGLATAKARFAKATSPIAVLHEMSRMIRELVEYQGIGPASTQARACLCLLSKQRRRRL